MARRPALDTDQQTAFNTALETGISRKDMEMIRLALQNGAEPEILLFAAIEYKRTLSDRWNSKDTGSMRLEWMRTATNAGANASATKKAGDYDKPKRDWPAIHWLHNNFDEKLMDHLLSNGAKIDDPDPDNDTLLMAAVKQGNKERAEYYIRKGADPMTPCGENGKNFPLQQLQKGSMGAKKKASLLSTMMKNTKQPAPQPQFTRAAPPKPKPPEEKPAPKPAPKPVEPDGILAPQAATFPSQEKRSFSI